MNKEIFIAVCDRLKTEVPQLRWIDAEEGQLNTGERPAVAFPCCLIDISYPSCETHMGGRQKIKAQIQVRVAFQSGGSTNAAAPKLVREHALRCMDTLDKIHEALQWWNRGTFSTRCAASGVRRKRGRTA
ncbi:MAG: hypothetical protein ACLUOK_05715 [Parabacteroides distasonis]